MRGVGRGVTVLLTTAGGVLFASACNLLVDFDDIEGLPCDCLQGYVCLSSSQTCVREGSVDTFKSCDIMATPSPNDLCAADPDASKPLELRQRDCVNINARGPRCLPRCTPRNPFVADVGREIENECGVGKYCWEVAPGVGYCDDGECNDSPDTCLERSATERCVLINGAGVCFRTCDVFSTNVPCGATPEHCQPVAGTRTTACLPSGARRWSEPCGLEEGACFATDRRPDTPTAPLRNLICSERPGSSSPVRTCEFSCNTAVGCSGVGEFCAIVIPNINDRDTSLGICEGG